MMQPSDITPALLNRIGVSPFYLNQNTDEMLNNLSIEYLTKTGYLESISFKAPIRNGLPIPWITYPALEFLEQTVSSNSRILEFGGGFSTLFWALRGNPIIYLENNDLWDNSILETSLEFSSILRGSIQQISKLLTDDMKSQIDLNLVKEVTISKFAFSEQLNQLFTDQINQSDLVVIDGDFRNYFLDLCSSSTTVSQIVLDNSDRNEYDIGINCMLKAGWTKIDFHGLGPINPYGWTTSIFLNKNIISVDTLLF